MNKEAKVFVAGTDTFIGQALFNKLQSLRYVNLLSKAKHDVNLRDPHQVASFFEGNAPEYVFLVAGKGGGIWENQKHSAELMIDNLQVACNVIECAYRYRVKKLLYLASSCTYPRHCPQPMQPDALLTGPLEGTSEYYALAKIAGMKLCQAYRRQYSCDFIASIPGDVFGPGDDFSLKGSHVVPALIRKMHEAKLSNLPSVEVWGTGAPLREFIYVDDLADACLFVMREFSGEDPINLGGGTECSIKDLAFLIRDIVGFSGEIVFNRSMPDGMPRKALDSSVLLGMGWRPKFSLIKGLKATYDWFLQQEIFHDRKTI